MNSLQRNTRLWKTLKQTHDINSYMNHVYKLYYVEPMAEKAEFMLAFDRLKDELKGIVSKALDEQDREWLTLPELKALPRFAEVERGGGKSTSSSTSTY